MQIHKGLNINTSIKNAVVTSGTFDGVHVGHQHVINQLKQAAKDINGESVVITFWPHPRLVIDPNCDLKLISDLDEKLDALNTFGIDHVWIIPFNRDFSLLSSSEFIENILIKSLSTKKLIIGYDHKFGKNREGSFQYLTENNHLFPFDIEQIQEQTTKQLTYSSTLIRNNLNNGNIEMSNKLMGHNYRLNGTVVKGLQNGKKLGFPTANIQVNFENKLIPADGSYAVKVSQKDSNKKHLGMLNIGQRPTLNAGSSIEVHILDFDEVIYGEQLEISFFKKLRDEVKFNSVEELKDQLKKDEIETRTYFNSL